MMRGNISIRIQAWRMKHMNAKNLVYTLSIVIGIIAGLAAVVLKTSVHYIEYFLLNTSEVNYENWLFMFFPFVGILLTVFFLRRFVKDDISHGITKILYAISKKNGKIKSHNMYSSMVACTLTGGFGGSVGMEAPILFTGSAIGSNLGQLFGLNRSTLNLLIGCGTAGAMAAIFKAPIAGLIFAFEVLMLDLTAASIIPLLIATVSGAIVSALLLGEQIEFYFTLKDPFNYKSIPFYILLGIVSGLISLYFVRINSYTEKILKKFKHPYRKVLFGGIALGLLIFVFPPLFGEGYSSMKSMLSGQPHELLNNSMFYSLSEDKWLFLLFLVGILFFKVVAMAITTGSGGIGGVFAPSLFMGGITGFTFAKAVNLISPSWIKLSESNFSLVGMAGLIAGVIHAPLTAIFLIAEITGGYGLFIPLIITASISYITIYYFEPHSIYTKQLAESGVLITHHKDKNVLRLMTIKSVIETDFIKISIHGTLGDLVGAIAKSKRNFFPVVDEQEHFCGVVMLDDVRDIMFEKSNYEKVLISDIVTMPLETASVKDNMETVMNKFKGTDQWNMPVTDNGVYVGFVSKSKIFDSYRDMLIEFSEE
jgi:chloride channel protein, CIC family